MNSGTLLTENMLVVALGSGAILSAVVAMLATAAFFRRRTVSYLLIAVACSVFLAKTLTGVGSLMGTIDPSMHHSIEHSLDVIMMALVLVAVYYARSGERKTIDTQ